MCKWKAKHDRTIRSRSGSYPAVCAVHQIRFALSPIHGECIAIAQYPLARRVDVFYTWALASRSACAGASVRAHSMAYIPAAAHALKRALSCWRRCVVRAAWEYSCMCGSVNERSRVNKTEWKSASFATLITRASSKKSKQKASSVTSVSSNVRAAMMEAQLKIVEELWYGEHGSLCTTSVQIKKLFCVWNQVL